MSVYFKQTFLLNKFLLSMEIGKGCSIATSQSRYSTIKSVCSQLKKQGLGVWRVSKKHCIDTTYIIREA